MANIEIDRIVWLKRCTNYATLIPLILYLPFGLLLGIIRFFIFLHACLLWFVLPEKFPLKRIILRTMLTVTGLPISIQGMPAVDNRKKIFIANHVSNLDPFILALLNPNILALDVSSSGISWSKGRLKTFEVPADKDHADVVKDTKDKMKDSVDPILFFPERLKTNGKSSLLKFSSLPFELDCPIQPVAIQAYRYLFDIHVSTHSSTVYKDIVWCFLTPLTLFKVKYLPLTEQKRDESKEEFASRVQSNMAKSLGLLPSDFSHHDVIEHVKNTVQREVRAPTVETKQAKSPCVGPSPGVQPSSHVSGLEVVDEDLRTMLRQVREVLPDTPTYCILADLKETRDVDITITNILEGRAKVAESVPEKKPAPEGLSFKAKKFESNARNRQLSFEERKQAMLEAARIKYKEKHGL